MNIVVVSRDSVANPLIKELMSAAPKIATAHPSTHGTVSHRYGKRFIITTSTATLTNLKEADFIEVVDYNPVNDTALIIGSEDASPDIPIHWLLYSRDDINTIIHVSPIKNTSSASIKGTTEQFLFNLGKEVFPLLRTHKKATLSDGTTIIVGRTLKETMEVLA